MLRELRTEHLGRSGRGNGLWLEEFGVFEIKTRAARKARNPRTGVRVDVPSKAVVHFKAGRAMKEMVQQAIATDVAPDAATPSPATEASAEL